MNMTDAIELTPGMLNNERYRPQITPDSTPREFKLTKLAGCTSASMEHDGWVLTCHTSSCPYNQAGGCSRKGAFECDDYDSGVIHFDGKESPKISRLETALTSLETAVADNKRARQLLVETIYPVTCYAFGCNANDRTNDSCRGHRTDCRSREDMPF